MNEERKTGLDGSTQIILKIGLRYHYIIKAFTESKGNILINKKNYQLQKGKYNQD